MDTIPRTISNGCEDLYFLTQRRVFFVNHGNDTGMEFITRGFGENISKHGRRPSLLGPEPG
jgi:hypothetical protein